MYTRLTLVAVLLATGFATESFAADGRENEAIVREGLAPALQAPVKHASLKAAPFTFTSVKANAAASERITDLSSDRELRGVGN